MGFHSRHCRETRPSENESEGCDAPGQAAGTRGIVFLPAAGNRGDTYIYGSSTSGSYWSSTLVFNSYIDGPYAARALFFGAYGFRDDVNAGGRRIGQTVRPVRN